MYRSLARRPSRLNTFSKCFSSVAVDAPASGASQLKSAWDKFTTTVVDDQLDIKALKNVQSTIYRLQEKGPIEKHDEFVVWTNEYFAEMKETLNKAEYEEKIDGIIAKLDALKESAWQLASADGVVAAKFDHNDVSEDKKDAMMKALHYMYVKSKCQDIKRYFDLLKTDESVSTAEIKQLVQLCATGTIQEWLLRYFNILDSDKDGALAEAEMQQLYLNILGVQKTFLTNVLTQHTTHMTKNHEKRAAKALTEFEWNFKLTEKLRCMWHFAGIPADVQVAQPPPVIPPRQSIEWALLQESQAAELPEFDEMLVKYTDAVYNASREFYAEKDAKRLTRLQSTAFLIFVTVTDVLVTLM